MTGFRVESEALAQLIENLARFERSAHSAAAEADREVRALHGEWAGAAAQAHTAAHQAWLDGAATMRAALLELHTLAGTAHANYTAAASANLRMWA